LGVDTVAVIDFETTGLSPARGDRPTEIAAVLVAEGRIVDRYQSLMNAGLSVPPFIERLTGISTAMLRRAPPVEQVMAEVADFVGTVPLVAHNAAFDSKFWDAELSRLGRQRSQSFVCTLLLARRVLPRAPSYKLGALVDSFGLPAAEPAHRALADAEMASHLMLRLEQELIEQFQCAAVTHDLLRRIQRMPKSQLQTRLAGEGRGLPIRAEL